MREASGSTPQCPGRDRRPDRLRLRPLPALRRADGLAARARRRPPRPRRRRAVRHVTRAGTAVARHGHRLVDRRPRHQAGALGRRQHPRRRADGDGRRVPPAPPPRRPVTPRRRHGRRRALRTRTFYVVPAGQPRRRRVGAGRPSDVPPVEHPPVAVGRRPSAGRASTSATSTATAASCRCGSPIPTARGCRTPTTTAPAGRRPARRLAPPARSRYRTARRGDGRRLRRVHDPDAPPARGARPQPQLPGRLGHRRARVAATTRCRSRRSTPSSGPSSPAPTSAATTRSTRAAACCCGRRRRSPTRRCRPRDMWDVEAARRARHGADRLPVALGVRGLHVGQVRHDERRRRRLGLRAPRRLLVDDRVLGRRRTPPPAHKQSTGLLVPRPDRRGGARRAAVGDEHDPGRYVDWYPFEHPQLGAVELGGWNDLGSWTNPPGRPAAGRGRRRTPSSPSFQALASPRLEIRTPRCRDLGGGTWRIEVGVANTAGSRRRCRRGRHATTASARSSPRSRGDGGSPSTSAGRHA